MRAIFRSIVVVVGLFLIASSSYAEVPRPLINYQARLTDSSGMPLTGAYDISFRIYDAEVAGNLKWSESHAGVVVDKGIVSILLGSITSLDLLFNEQYWLTVQVGGDPEMTPRQIIASVGYAIRAEYGVPKGSIIMWSGAIANIPNGWALCNGTNGTPDLRDRFVVGAGTTYNPDDTGGEAFHTLTIDEMPAHRHGCNERGRAYGEGNTFAEGAGTERWTGYTGGDQPHENRPPYYALAYIMKI